MAVPPGALARLCVLSQMFQQKGFPSTTLLLSLPVSSLFSFLERGRGMRKETDHLAPVLCQIPC